MTAQQEAEQFLLDVVGIDESQLEPDRDLLMTGVLDSLTVIRLVHHLEAKLGVKVPYADIHPGNFATLALIGDYADRLVEKSQTVE